MMEKDIPGILDSMINDLKEVREGGLSDNECVVRLISNIAIEIEWHRVFIKNLMDLLETREVVTREERAELRATTDETLHGFAERLLQATGVEDSEK